MSERGDERMPVAGAPEPARPAAVPAVPPTSDIAAADVPPALPGEHRGGFRREMTAPVDIALPVMPEPEPEVRWAPPEPVLPRTAGWSLLFGILALVMALFVGWGIPIGLAGVVLAVLAFRRPWENRASAAWGLGLSITSLVYSAGWLWWASTQGPLFG